jgi:hypothetical protein
MTSGPEHGEPVSLGFDIADGEQVELAYGGDQLVLRFVDWHEQPIRATFQGTVAFRWQRAERVNEGERFDSPNVVRESAWLAEHRRQSEATPEHRHLKLNFNAAGVLEVICLGVAVHKE